MTTTASDDDTLRLRIKSFKDVEISVPAGSVVAYLKQQVKAALLDADDSQDRYLRLICKGRLLLPDDHPISDFNVQDGDVVHAVLATNKATDKKEKADQALARTRRRHMVVGPGGRVTRAPNHGESDEEESLPGGERRGFDRLRVPNNGISAVPLSRPEVTALRAYFSRHIDRHLAQHPGIAEEDPMQRRYLAEEDWMSQQGPASEFRLNVSAQNLFMANVPRATVPMGTDRDFMWGFMLGFFVGFVMLVWVWIPTGKWWLFFQYGL
jgi:DUF2407 C-terminal domain/DUF2407 ubiquitin-like domain